MANSMKMFTVDKFLGLNESADSTTELKMGEAAKAENFYITDGHNIRRRPGVKCEERCTGTLCGFRTGKRGETTWFLTAAQNGNQISVRTTYSWPPHWKPHVFAFMPIDTDYPVKMFDFGGCTYIFAKHETSASVLSYCIRNGSVDYDNDNYYLPLAITGMAPAGGGEEFEPLNILCPDFRLQFSADGETKEYHLPPIANGVRRVTIDGLDASGTFNEETKVYTFTNAPGKGVNNVEFFCYTNDTQWESAFLKFCAMKHCEAYNGVTDTRLFFYGDGTNVCFYTETPTDADGLYLPLGNEIRFDMSPAPITGMCRCGTRLMVYQQDSTSTVSYEPITLADGRITAGFYVRPASRTVGNEMDAQVQTVNNFPRTLCGGSLYEWRNSASYYQDERYAKRVSEKITKTLASAVPQRIVTCDDNPNKTYYMFLNDDAGTVLVNRYDLDVWTIYTGEVFKGILYAQVCGDQMLFATEKAVFCFDDKADYDAAATDGGEETAIEAVWESGFMSFGADYLKKYASRIWLSLFPDNKAELEVTVRTDKRDDYITKTVGYSFFDFSSMDFGRFSFVTRNVPLVKRIQIKVKKFVYYKLIFRVSTPGARATVLGYDQQVRYSSPVK